MFISLLSDGVDGYIARRFNQATELGKILDPLCDKISLAVILVTLLLLNALPIWIVIFIIMRDVLILIGSYIVLKQKSRVLTSNALGKVTGMIFGAIILAYTINLKQIGLFLVYLSIPAIVGSFILYTRRYLKVMKGVQ
jgi:CDP-diacylglycerol--glycerol-3-phosphate 3-phosphatidyltransferase